MATTPDYTIDYNDERFLDVEAEKEEKLTETKTMYDTMINESDSYYQEQIDATKEWAETQADIQQQNTDFAIELIGQQKDQALTDYTKEQKGAYADYQKEINAYGVQAEQMAASGLSNSGYSETSRVNMFNTYQNRYATAKDSYNRAVLNYDNNIKEAQLANNAKLAEIAYQALQEQLQLSLQGFQYKNTLILQQADAINKVEDTYYNRYQDVLAQINAENSLAESIRQHNEQMEEERRQYNETLAFQKAEAERDQRNWEKEYALSRSSVYGGGSSSSGSSAKLTNGGTTNNGSKLTQTNNNNTQSTGSTVKLSNGKTGYTSATAAYKAGGMKAGPLSEKGILNKKLVGTTQYNGKTYYFAL